MPSYDDSFGYEAVELADYAGLKLDPWQKDAVIDCMSIRADKKWNCFEYAEFVPRQNGKGAILEARVLAGLLLLKEKTITWTAHEHKTSSAAFRRIRDLVYSLEQDNYIDPAYVRINSGYGQELIEIREPDNPRIVYRLQFIARSKGSGRGFTGDLVIVDETFGYTVDQQAALLYTLSAVPNPQIIYTSTPPLEGSTGEVMYDLRQRALLGNDPALGYRDWGLDGDLDDVASGKIDLDDRSNWSRANPAMGIRIATEAVERERRGTKSLSRLEFARERLGIWPRQMVAGGAIDADKWARLQDPSSRRVGKCALGVDIAPDRKCYAIGLYGEGLGVGHVELVSFDYDTRDIVKRVKEIVNHVSPIAIGMGKATFASLEVEFKAEGFKLSEDAKEPEHGDLVVFNGLDLAAACGHILDAVRDSSFKVRPHKTMPEVLDSAVSSAQLKQTSDAVTWVRKEKSNDITSLQAITIARYAYTSRVDLIKEKKAVFFVAWR